MGKIYYVMGKSCSGKDTIYRRLTERHPELRVVVPYTTRPIREGEQDGVEYFSLTGRNGRNAGGRQDHRTSFL